MCTPASCARIGTRRRRAGHLAPVLMRGGPTGGERGTMPTILVADDVAGVRRLLRGALMPPHEVFEAADGDEALALLQRVCPTVAILDIDMPGLTGLAVCARIRADPRLAAIRVLIMSANGEHD